MTNYSESIANKMRLSANKHLAERYARRRTREWSVEDKSGRPVIVVKKVRRSNGLLDE
jgi:hypothetical protein